MSIYLNWPWSVDLDPCDLDLWPIFELYDIFHWKTIFWVIFKYLYQFYTSFSDFKWSVWSLDHSFSFLCCSSPNLAFSPSLRLYQIEGCKLTGEFIYIWSYTWWLDITIVCSEVTFRTLTWPILGHAISQRLFMIETWNLKQIKVFKGQLTLWPWPLTYILLHHCNFIKDMFDHVITCL